ncbi:similar to Saccharomyces cerevisiae YOR193W PEX27 Peripheral peroxisomal membrane protein involved in controlling peroxisome size and number [Maudiozyma saulgeensis]|uniref:Similar to Saccharomyces cerevisiae YOR193W PEX27 Peripheral peroxisomal membrane protein involved in controlling peroxisome size and number n=1 Tax=Maudiozyma saulgeensis TaxID=1789683 RepID=A0A1X7R1L1_9SACH|nr:similar to Saccharomyces cerevisiae YOR193W PEX27 Peripheral peroxisomal membrane protein involved in controlling peroxisome size and number [Kazachstania saulgeensis]
MDSSYLSQEELLSNQYPTTDIVPNIFNQPMTKTNTQILEVKHIPSGEDDTIKINKCKENKKKIVVENMEILQYLINSLGGKDKLAKILKYILQIINLFISNVLKNYKRKNLNTNDLIIRYSFLKNLKNILLKPNFFVYILSSKINKNLGYVIDQLGTYRYILRFGNSPFLIYKMIEKIKKIWCYDNKLITFQENLINLFGNENAFRDILNLYYTICDELVLLYKFKLWSNPILFETISRHESWTWQADIIFSLKDLFIKLTDLQDKELEYTIQLQVKERATQLYTNNNNHLSPVRQKLLHDLKNLNDCDNENLIIKRKLNQIKLDKRLVHLDILKLSFDASANSIDLFNVKTPPIVYPLLSLGSGITSFIKMWKQAKNDIIKEKQNL